MFNKIVSKMIVADSVTNMLAYIDERRCRNKCTKGEKEALDNIEKMLMDMCQRSKIQVISYKNEKKVKEDVSES